MWTHCQNILGHGNTTISLEPISQPGPSEYKFIWLPQNNTLQLLAALLTEKNLCEFIKNRDRKV
jgi:hypothetical protein